MQRIKRFNLKHHLLFLHILLLLVLRTTSNETMGAMNIELTVERGHLAPFLLGDGKLRINDLMIIPLAPQM